MARTPTATTQAVTNEPVGAAGPVPRAPWTQWLTRFRETGVFLAFALLFGSMMAFSSTFRQIFNLVIVLKQMSTIAIMACGQTLVMISGAFDLSQGPIAGLVAMVTALLWSSFAVPPVLALVLGFVTGALCGLTNGVLAAKLKLHPIIMTLATSTIFTGLIYVVSEGNPVVNIPNAMLEPGAGTYLGFPVNAMLMLGVTLVMQVILTRTLFGLHVRQVGGNRAAARVTGVRVQRVWVGVFVVSGLLSALGGIVELGRVGNAVPDIGSTLLFPIISATIVGGTLLTGGEGSMIGTLLGAAVLTIIDNALVILAVNIYLQDVVQGLLVLVALVIDQVRRGNLTFHTLVRREL